MKQLLQKKNKETSRSLWCATSFALAASTWMLDLAHLLKLFARVHVNYFTSPPSPKYTQGHTGALLELLAYHGQRTYKNMYENGIQIFPSRFSLWGGREQICRRTCLCHPEAGKIIAHSPPTSSGGWTSETFTVTCSSLIKAKAKDTDFPHKPQRSACKAKV